MSKSQRLEPVIRVSESKERGLARELAQALKLYQAQQARLEELEGYRAEYENALKAQAASSLSAASLQQYRRFIDRLAEAIAYQGHRVAEAQRLCEERRAAWMAARQRRRLLEGVAQRYRRAERQAAERREQRECDEHAQNGRHGRES